MTHLDTKRHPWTVFVLPKMCYHSHKCVTSYEQTSKTVLRQEEKGHKRCGRCCRNRYLLTALKDLYLFRYKSIQGSVEGWRHSQTSSCSTLER